jgi:hypothetical protein
LGLSAGLGYMRTTSACIKQANQYLGFCFLRTDATDPTLFGATLFVTQ